MLTSGLETITNPVFVQPEPSQLLLPFNSQPLQIAARFKAEHACLPLRVLELAYETGIQLDSAQAQRVLLDIYRNNCKTR